jgi:hypothetical protein
LDTFSFCSLFFILLKIGTSARFINQRAHSRFFASTQNDWFLFPRESEGNTYSVNWSLAEDGVVNTGEAFRNARLPILTTRLATKVENGKAKLSGPAYTSQYSIEEAGDSVSHQDFNGALSELQAYLSSGQALFVEDASLGSYNKARVGVRVITDNVATALICRTLFVSYIISTSWGAFKLPPYICLDRFLPLRRPWIIERALKDGT